MPDVEAHITGTVWKIECEVGDSDRRGRHRRDPRVDEDGDARRGRGRGHRQGDPLRGGPGGERGRHARRPRVARRSRRSLDDAGASGVLRLTISNPAKRNALDHAILDGDRATRSATPDARCIVLTGEHGMFSVGLRHRRHPRRRLRRARPRSSSRTRSPARSTRSTPRPCPTVAALTGHTIGGGLELALACDLRIAADGIKLGMPPAKLGLVYSHTGLRRFIDAIGVAAHARAVPARPQHRRDDRAGLGARQRGRHRARRSPSAALELASELAGNAPLSRAAATSGSSASCCAPRASSTRDVERELIALREACFASEDMREGVRAFGEKRAPRWRGR